MKIALSLIYLFIEVYVTITIASEIGFLYTFLIILFSAVFGIVLIFNTPFKMAEIMQNILGSASLVAFGIFTFLRIFAAFLLILPGFFGDIVGIILLVGSFLFAPKQNKQDVVYSDEENHKHKKEEIIDVEIIDDNNNIK